MSSFFLAHISHGLIARLFQKKTWITLLLILSFSATVNAADVTLAWDANTEADLAGYMLYYKTGSGGVPYDGTDLDQGDSFIDIPVEELEDPDNPTFFLSGLEEGETYYFSLTAYNLAGDESGFSNEIQYTPDPIIIPPDDGFPGMDIPQSSWISNGADSEATGYESQNAIDGDPSTIWHTQWGVGATDHPHHVTLELAESTMISGFRYVPRQDMENGRIDAFKFYVSEDGITWVEVASGRFLNSTEAQDMTFAAVSARFVRLESLSEVNGNEFTAVAELIALEQIPMATLPVQSGEADSEAYGYGYENAVDGNPETIWHTQWGYGASDHPHHITMELSESTLVCGFRYLPRQDMENGRIDTFKFYVSDDGVVWEEKIHDRFLNSSEEQEHTFTPIPARFVRLESLSEVNGNEFAAVAELAVLGMVQGYTITASVNGLGAVSPSGAVTVERWASQSFEITPDENYRISDVLVDGESMGAMDSYTFENVSENHSLEVILEKDTFIVTASSGDGGMISPYGFITVNKGANLRIDLTPDEDYTIKDVKVDGKSIGVESSYEFISISADHTISVSFEPITHVISAWANDNGSISPSGDSEVNHGASLSVDISPDDGYVIHDVLIDGQSIGSVSNYQFENITEDHSIEAIFKIREYVITADAGPFGSISPMGTLSVEHGGSQMFSITPEQGYHILELRIDGAVVDPVQVYGFININSNHAISVTFAPDLYTLSATAGPGGEISPNGMINAEHGTDKIFTITADSGYVVEDVMVDGLSVGVVKQYAFSSISSSHTIEVIFEKAPHKMVWADSEATGYECENAVDGDPNTFWHTQWGKGAPDQPHGISLVYPEPLKIYGFQYLPRQDNENGRISKFRFFVSENGNTWKEMASGRFDNSDEEQVRLFPPVYARYVLLQSLSEVNGNVFTSVAELSIIDEAPQKTVWADSEAAGYESENAVDGDPNTFWHTKYGVGAPDQPHGISMIFPGPTTIYGFRYLPRQDNENGRISKFRFFVSDDGNTWNEIVSGRFDNSNEEQVRVFSPVVARYVLLQSLSEVNGNVFTSVAELSVIENSPLKIVPAKAVSAVSEALGYEYHNATDQNPDTLWHTQWVVGAPKHPHHITLELAETDWVCGFRYLPRQDMENGRITEFRFYVSEDGESWKEVMHDTLVNTKEEQEQLFTPAKAKFVRLESLGEVNGNGFTSLAELTVLGQYPSQ